jgi:riboflavin kinase/FMN adenylyltransferase
MRIFKAKVISGQGRGRRIGFPTINLDKLDLDLDYGVYLAKIIFKGRTYKGLLHFGPKKTFGEGISVEVYIKDFNLDIYGKSVKIITGRRIRSIKKFGSPEELMKQIKKDLQLLND